MSFRDTKTAHDLSEGAKWFFGIVAVIVVIGLVVLIGWQVNWWFTTQNTNRESRLYQHGYGNQDAARDEISRKLEVVDNITVQMRSVKNDPAEVNMLGQQRLAVAQIVCRDAAQVDSVDSLPKDQQEWVNQNCVRGHVDPDSALYGN